MLVAFPAVGSSRHYKPRAYANGVFSLATNPRFRSIGRQHSLTHGCSRRGPYDGALSGEGPDFISAD